MSTAEEMKRHVEHEKNIWSAYYQRKLKARSSKKFSAFWWQYYHAQISDYIKSIVPISREFSVLEAGSGTGKASILTFPDSKIVLLDLVPEGLELAKRFAGRCGKENVDYVIGDIFSMPFDNNSFDFVWNVGVLEHYEEEYAISLLMEMFRVTKKGGRIAVAIPNFRSLPSVKARLLSSKMLKGILGWVPGYRMDTEKKYTEFQIEELLLTASGEVGLKIELTKTSYLGSPFFVGTPKLVIKLLSPFAEIFFYKKKFLMLSMAKVL